MEEETRTEQSGLITEELRDWMGASTHNTIGTELIMGSYNKLLAIADRIDAEHESACAEAYGNGVMSVPIALDESAWVKLPVDADGVPIHVGDELDGYGKTIEVVELRHGRSGWVLISRDGNAYHDTFAFSHHHAPTVEDVLREFAQAMNENMGMYTGEAIDADEWRDADNKTVSEYAAKLRLAEEAE